METTPDTLHLKTASVLRGIHDHLYPGIILDIENIKRLFDIRELETLCYGAGFTDRLSNALSSAPIEQMKVILSFILGFAREIKSLLSIGFHGIDRPQARDCQKNPKSHHALGSAYTSLMKIGKGIRGDRILIHDLVQHLIALTNQFENDQIPDGNEIRDLQQALNDLKNSIRFVVDSLLHREVSSFFLRAEELSLEQNRAVDLKYASVWMELEALLFETRMGLMRSRRDLEDHLSKCSIDIDECELLALMTDITKGQADALRVWNSRIKKILAEEQYVSLARHERSVIEDLFKKAVNMRTEMNDMKQAIRQYQDIYQVEIKGKCAKGTSDAKQAEIEKKFHLGNA